tara:strand:+ start:586 stop:1482 length:897 start_codon:yes stop_codon:yes gene_type:complete
LDRRDFIKTTAILTGGASLGSILSCADNKMSFKISLAEWSLNRTLFSGKLDHLDFCRVAKKDFGINAVEYVNQFFFDKAEDRSYLKEMKDRAEDLGVINLLIMCDKEGDLGDPDQNQRTEAIENHYKWAEAAKFLGCHSIRVNAKSEGSYDEQIHLAAEGLRKLTEYGDSIGINTIVENHGGLSSNGKWLASVIEKVDHPRCGTLPDFGNFKLEGDDWYDRYLGVKELMPYAKAVSAKSNDFNSDGEETNTDYYKMMDIVLSEGYSGYVGIEYEGRSLDEMSGIRATKKLLEKVRRSL